MDEKTLNSFYNGDTILVKSVKKDFHSEVTYPGLVSPQISYDTCARLNALINYAKLDLYIYMGDSIARIRQVKPGDNDFIECVVECDGDIMEVMVSTWVPFLLYLRRK